ncbi:hypothetical protein Ngar_c13480 [Candidatus Nitrososphaera gargensis Ga9.2]|uniref:Uncharacterized protein n=1 Tax=Nitrososphaera gargensis (strain Ga9.2) TaxID=1237085 RepID=K0IAE8_NITGG|nr:hypothetical protein [Candidatus Nitrososphaera gargensis]AFU58286.1 hypothetical protein Ngar_c13480 [Candidatus Nitrososphaera gargensis Ga9.2]
MSEPIKVFGDRAEQIKEGDTFRAVVKFIEGRKMVMLMKQERPESDSSSEQPKINAEPSESTAMNNKMRLLTKISGRPAEAIMKELLGSEAYFEFKDESRDDGQPVVAIYVEGNGSPMDKLENVEVAE